MKLPDVLRMAFRSLITRRLRSWLTILGIVIGVAAVVALVSIGQGLQASIESQLSGLGGSLIFISPGHSRSQTTFGGGGFGGGEGGFGGAGTIAGNLTDNDLRLIKSIPGVYVATGMLNKAGQVKYISEVASINIQGAEPGLHRLFSSVKAEAGRDFLAGDDQVAMIGHAVAHDLFKNPIDINDAILINGQRFRVIAILQASGPASPTDNLVIIPLQAARRLFPDYPKDQYAAFVARVSDNVNPKDIANKIEQKLFLSHHVTKDTQDFTVITSESILQTIAQITSTITLFLGGIAAISLLVGGIGIANTMFMSVMERTRQIGILKALGATNFDVMQIFLSESGTLGLVGGIFGVCLGYLVSLMLSRISFFGGGAQAITTSVTPSLAIFAVIFSVVIGIVSGLLPARRASKLQPTEALRYE